MKSKKRNRNEELNFLYFEDKAEEKKQKKKSPQEEKKKKKKAKEIEDEFYEIEKESKKKRKKNNKGVRQESKKKQKSKKEEQEETNDTFNFENEIVIGVTKIPTGPAKKKTSGVSKTGKTSNNKKTNKKGAGSKSAPRNKKKTKKKKKKTLATMLIKWTILLGALIAAIIFFMMSPLFDIIEIEVIGNEKITKETILSLSGISLGDNIYHNKKEAIEKNIKQEAYIESVEVKRMLPNKLQLQIKERKPTFLLEYASSYLYMNNQGYILEISNEVLDVPIITGYTTSTEELQVGKRLNKEDLMKLETVLKIVEAIASNGITSKVDRIDMTNKKNYTLHMEEEKKIVYLGDASHLSSRMLYIKVAIDDTKGLEGEIFAGGNLETEKVFFREKQPEPEPDPTPEPTQEPQSAGDEPQTGEPRTNR